MFPLITTAPLDPRVIIKCFFICFPKDTTTLPGFKEKSQAYYQRLDDALDEDIVALENQQKGLNKSTSLQGQFSTLMEANVAAFSEWYANKII